MKTNILLLIVFLLSAIAALAIRLAISAHAELAKEQKRCEVYSWPLDMIDRTNYNTNVIRDEEER